MPHDAKCIAIVDDDASVRDATGSLIRSLGLKVRTFSSAADLLALPDRDAIDCLITDVQMDPIGGVELFQRLRDEGIAMPVIFITAFPDARIRDRMMTAGALGFFAKPFDAQALIDCVEAAIAP
ncbi:response regulator [Kaistia dalseonensis]|uniref:FixJ family two-component response regulator n=1 Tax=Kaistia dalseonensis TaxID=410840 RepID=A0ABU0H2Y5_9HYPH|nr:response regulator [Kaistia dalseonensis]MCX5493279.1 response regulator [Kaistia dalseonensis]MDQ0435836.1 FixJ family two-component response regulator [Kaistia dalseonensis]